MARVVGCHPRAIGGYSVERLKRLRTRSPAPYNSSPFYQKLVAVPRFRFWPLILTAFLIVFLWLPPLSLYGEALWHVIRAEPARLSGALPGRPLPRFLFVNTLALSALTALIAVVLGLPVGIAMARGPHGFRPLCTLLCALPLALPPMMLASAWLEVTRTPPARSMASLAATEASSWNPILIAAPILALSFFPVVAFAVFAALRAVPPDAEDAARLWDNGWGAWRRVLGPLLWPALAGAAGIVAALAMWEMGAPDLVDARTYSVQIYRDLNAPDRLDPQGKYIQAALAGLPMLALGCLALWPAAHALRFYGTKVYGSGGGNVQTVPRMEGRIAAALAALVLLVSPLSPLGVFVRQLHPPGVLLEVWGNNDREIYNTVILATVAALLITAVAFVVVAAWRAWSPRVHSIALLGVVSALLVSPVMTGVALIGFWNRPQFALIYGGLPPSGIGTIDWLTDTIARYAMMVIGYMARFLPLSVLLLDEAARRVDTTLLDAAQGSGASGARAARTILAPLLSPALLGNFALVWALCASELPTSVLINAPGGQTLPVPIFNLMHIGSTAEVAALCLTLTALSGGALALTALVLRFWKRR
jgi:iron(III) transport system permease protein